MNSYYSKELQYYVTLSIPKLHQKQHITAHRIFDESHRIDNGISKAQLLPAYEIKLIPFYVLIKYNSPDKSYSTYQEILGINLNLSSLNNSPIGEFSFLADSFAALWSFFTVSVMTVV